MRRINQFVTAVAKKWGSLVTGGVFIGLLATWQGTGHSVSPWIYGGIAAGGAIVAIFKAWEEQAVRAELAEGRVKELQGRPDLALSVEQFQPQMSDPPEWGAGSGKLMHRFMVRNGGPVQAVNVSIDDIPPTR